ncbi:MAG: hypothetical protein JWQ30_2620 [Sediminibacterium sp.]|nr:hypothetical protein [Sediminibacterium sp.]
MKQNTHNTLQWCFFIVIWAGICCNKKFDSPPAYTGPSIQPNISIRDLRAMHFTGNFERILGDHIIEGIVVADDSKDNFYKSIVIQDSTAGITVRMDGSGLYNDYPVGRRVVVKLKDLWLGDYAKMIQLGAAVDRSDPVFPELVAIPTTLFERYIIKKELNNTVVPKHVRLDQLNDSLQSCLIAVDNVEFSVSDTGKPYADAVNKLSANATVKSCSGGSAYIRTSGFANFAGAKAPRGNGTLTAIYSVFGTTKQLLIRDTSDVQMNGLRCTGAGAKLLFNENFENAAANMDINLTGWKNISESGSISFTAKTTNNNIYAEISAFATNKPVIVSWLIIPAVNLSNSANEVLSFQTKDGFDNGAVFQVYVSTNYDGGNTPWKAKWTALKATIAKGSISAIRNDWVPSGSISLAGFSGMVYIAFRYDGADPGNVFDKRTTTFQLDNVRVEGN